MLHCKLSVFALVAGTDPPLLGLSIESFRAKFAHFFGTKYIFFMNKAVTVGLVGLGAWGKKLHNALLSIEHCRVCWRAGSENWWTQETVDWVVIASPTIFHYEQTKYFLEKGINVFCEKPLALTPAAVDQLFRIAEENDRRLYVDDILSYSKANKIHDTYIWKKSGRLNSNIWDRLAYHHFYLIRELELEIESCKITINSNWAKRFSINFVGTSANKTINFDYQISDSKINVTHSVACDGTELQRMLKAVLEGSADFQNNRTRTVYATKMCHLLKEVTEPKILVIGGGIYGITSAIALAEAGYKVVLNERHSDLMREASGSNQMRIHRGYHYPRSSTTIMECKSGRIPFQRLYARAILPKNKVFYSIASERSNVSGAKYKEILDRYGLEYEEVDNLTTNCEMTLLVDERMLSIDRLRQICRDRLMGAGVLVELGKEASMAEALSTGYMQIVDTTYRETNCFRDSKIDLQFELCEKPVFRLPELYKGKGIVIMDGPFMCFDPWGVTDFHVAGNVRHAIHQTFTGESIPIENIYLPLINRGLIAASEIPPGLSRAHTFIEDASQFFPGIGFSEHVGSMFVIRSVLPNHDDTDERPTTIDIEHNRIFIFGGKLSGCIIAAENAVSHCRNTLNRRQDDRKVIGCRPC